MNDYTEIEVKSHERDDYMHLDNLDNLTAFYLGGDCYIKTSSDKHNFFNAIRVSGDGAGKEYSLDTLCLVLPVKSKITIVKGDMGDE